MAYTAAIFTSAIVAIGDFNPAIFSPDWLEGNKLIGKGDADAVRDQSQGQMIVSHQVASFQTKWFALQVLSNQFSLTSKDALSPAFKDLAVGIFQLLPHTPITAVGLNFLAHFKLVREDDYHKVGDVLAPKKIWNELYPEDAVGLANLTVKVQHGVRGKELKMRDEINIAVSPSEKFKFGISMSYNNHHNLSTPSEENLKPADRVATLIDGGWETTWKDADRVFNGLLLNILS